MPPDLIYIAHDTLHNIAFEPINLLFATKFTRTVTHDFTRLQVTMKMEIDHSAFSFVRQQIVNCQTMGLLTNMESFFVAVFLAELFYQVETPIEKQFLHYLLNIICNIPEGFIDIRPT